jgi:uracil-DNA glycosylase
MQRIISSGPEQARIMIVGEAPGEEEARTGQPFVGAAGFELTKMLSDAGIDRHRCFITNVVHERPLNNEIEQFFHLKTEARLLGIQPLNGKYPNAIMSEGIALLKQMILQVKPDIIIGFGNTPLWALTSESGIMSWRGSSMRVTVGDHECDFMPTIHPAAILRNWADRFLVIKDLQRVANALRDGGLPKRPNWRFRVAPTFDQVMDRIDTILEVASHGSLLLATDIETRGGQIACIGFAWTTMDAMCVPMMSATKPPGYWNEQEELAIIIKLRELLTHPNIHCIFHNGSFDCQYIAYQWGFMPNIKHDTMIAQHVAFAGLRKGLSVCSSLYCYYHRYWKDDGKTWDTHNEQQLWTYNCEDCVRTLEVHFALQQVHERLGVQEPYAFQVSDFMPVLLKAMLRGVLIDKDRRALMDKRLELAMQNMEAWFEEVLGHKFNPKSPIQMQRLLYEDFGVPARRNRKTKKITTDDDALVYISQKYPLLRPFLDKVRDFRSAGVFLSTFVRATIPPDGRIRCTYSPTGTETFRLSSSEDAFGFGTNLQNVPAGDE